MKTSFKLFSVWGIPIRIHISLLALMAIVGVAAWSLGIHDSLPVRLEKVFFNIALLAIVFSSIALHELAHSLVAIRKGCSVREITLMFVGGAAQMEEIPRNPSDEIQIALAGPLFSLGLAAVAWFGGAHLQGLPLLPALYGDGFFNILQLTGQINLALALFNLLPAYPMDGGRIFRAVVSRKIGFIPATFVASRLGRVLAIVMGIYGFRSGYFGLIIIAVFLFRAAGREFDYVLKQELANGMQTLASWVSGGIPCEPAVKEMDGHVKISPPPYERK
jgi:Zn-dependent protease